MKQRISFFRPKQLKQFPPQNYMKPAAKTSTVRPQASHTVISGRQPDLVATTNPRLAGYHKQGRVNLRSDLFRIPSLGLGPFPPLEEQERA